MFKIAERTELNQISLTGMRSIVLMGLLIVAPRSLEEIRKAFIDLNIMEDENSDDILRIDLNTIKAMGCEISRASAKTGFKYVLSKHPFSLNVTDDEIHLLKRAYNRVKDGCNIEALLEYDELFKKIASFIYDEKMKEGMLGISALKYYDIENLKSLMFDCEQQRIIELLYKKPTGSSDSRKRIAAQDLVFKNDKIYLYGRDMDKDEPVVLNFKRIKTIISRKPNEGILEPKNTKVKFYLKDFEENYLNDNETVLQMEDGKYLIEGSYHNDFIAVQRILSFGSKCVVVEPADFRNVIIEKLKEMRKAYEC